MKKKAQTPQQKFFKQLQSNLSGEEELALIGTAFIPYINEYSSSQKDAVASKLFWFAGSVMKGSFNKEQFADAVSHLGNMRTDKSRKLLQKLADSVPARPQSERIKDQCLAAIKKAL